ncbi:hypothetical protein PORY_000607 [Pneumocystis oryctolagi]|uniref:Uncharacterized protein n=1 Tax=Pneumocystis oryctolagi TaxID=42067 RepID=A0ACB7CGG1_9ASCO|nr:hypothetical protein PORY_000607 [Pneumocystis oryctolagi]
MTKTNSIHIYKQDFRISIYTFLFIFFHSNFDELFISFNTFFPVLSILPLDSYFLLTLHFLILSFISSIAFPSLSIEEISLTSHVITHLLLYFVSSQTNLPHELFFILAIFGPIIGILLAIPFLKKYVQITQIHPHYHTQTMKIEHIKYAIFSYLIIIISIFIILQFGFKKDLTKNKNLIFWLIDYIMYEDNSNVRQKMLLWWIICLILSIFFIKISLYTSKTSYNNEKISHIQLNKRRKFFHGIIIIMFLPTLHLDPLFSNISFSVALLLFFVSEIIRKFTLPPYGISLHHFLSKFTDERDNKGNIIVGHLYLLIGCASPLWLDFVGITFIEQNQYQLKLRAISGILSLGFGDSTASLIGKKIGRLHWPNSKKTVEGTFAFILAVLFGGMLAKYMSWIKDVIIWTDFFIATIMTALFEAFSSQNDNILMPIYMWSLLKR